MTQYAWRAVTDLAKAAAKDVVGNVVPFWGVIETTVELLVPQLERDLENMRNATTQLDRLFILHDNLARLEVHARFIEQWISFTQLAAAQTNRKFQADVKWLSETLENAARD